MSGCGIEYMMAVRKTSDTNSAPYYQNSGFNANTMPALKYYNLYEYVSASSDYTKRILGDATGETNGWYGDAKTFVYSSSGWFKRGGYYGHGASAGSFNFNSNTGRAYVSYSSRGVLLQP